MNIIELGILAVLAVMGIFLKVMLCASKDGMKIAIKKHMILIITGLSLPMLLIFGYISIGNYNYDTGAELGYSIGYSIGYTDAKHGIEQYDQRLASEIVPYEYGSARWKGFVMHFSEGYIDGQKR